MELLSITAARESRTLPRKVNKRQSRDLRSHQSSLLSTFGSSNGSLTLWQGGGFRLGLGGDLGDLGSLGLLGLDLFQLALLDLLDSGIVLLVTFVARLGLSSLDFVEGHANNGLLDAGGLAGALSGQFVDADFLVEASPCLCPGKLDGLDFLGEHAAGFVGNEEVKLAVFGDESAAFSGVDLVLSVGANFSFRNHF